MAGYAWARVESEEEDPGVTGLQQRGGGGGWGRKGRDVLEGGLLNPEDKGASMAPELRPTWTK